MRRPFKALLIVLASITLSTALAQVEPRADIRVVVVTHGAASDPFWSVVKNGVDQAAADMGITVDYRAPDTFDMPAMAQLIDAAVASSPDGLIVSIPDADALGPSVQSAVDDGIPVFSINSGSDTFEGLGVLRHIGQTEYEAGLGAGERMRDAGVKDGICVNHEVGNIALDQRCQGFLDGLGSGAQVKVLAVSTDPTEIQNAVTAAFSGDPNIDGVLATGPVGAEPTIAALADIGKLGQVQMGSFDLSPTILQTLADGNMAFAIDQQQYLQGYLAVVDMTLYIQYGLLPGSKVILTGPGFVTPDNAAQVIELSKQGIR